MPTFHCHHLAIQSLYGVPKGEESVEYTLGFDPTACADVISKGENDVNDNMVSRYLVVLPESHLFMAMGIIEEYKSLI